MFSPWALTLLTVDRLVVMARSDDDHLLEWIDDNQQSGYCNLSN